jgi:hypothetical protein
MAERAQARKVLEFEGASNSVAVSHADAVIDGLAGAAKYVE